MCYIFYWDLFSVELAAKGTRNLADIGSKASETRMSYLNRNLPVIEGDTLTNLLIIKL